MFTIKEPELASEPEGTVTVEQAPNPEPMTTFTVRCLIELPIIQTIADKEAF